MQPVNVLKVQLRVFLQCFACPTHAGAYEMWSVPLSNRKWKLSALPNDAAHVDLTLKKAALRSVALQPELSA